MKRTFGVVLSVLTLLLAGTAGTQKPQSHTFSHQRGYHDTDPNQGDVCDPSGGPGGCVPACPDPMNPNCR
jgi:hypothetical protein